MAGKKAKRFEDGGVVGGSNYPFGQGQTASSSSAPTADNSGLNNKAPLVQITTPGAQTEETADPAKPFGMKKGGKVSTSRRGDGIAQRGKTRGRIV